MTVTVEPRERNGRPPCTDRKREILQLRIPQAGAARRRPALHYGTQTKCSARRLRVKKGEGGGRWREESPNAWPPRAKPSSGPRAATVLLLSPPPPPRSRRESACVAARGTRSPPSRGALLSSPSSPAPQQKKPRRRRRRRPWPCGGRAEEPGRGAQERRSWALRLLTDLPPSSLPLSARLARGKEGLAKSRSILNICCSKYTTSKMGVKTFTHSSPAHSQEMLGKLNMLRNDGHFCDITIRVQDKIFRAHKVVLAACSDFFRSKLVGQAEDDSQSVLDLHHVTVTGFLPLLEYAYTATLSINTENIIDVLAAASYMQMFSVASTCSEFMKSSILWNTPNSQQEKVLDTGQENSANCNFASRDGSLSPVSSECSVVERTIPVCRESRRKRKSYIVMSPESPLKCNTQTNSPQVLTTSASYAESRSHPVDSSLAFPWTFPFGIDRRLQTEKVKQVENSRTLEVPGPSEASRRISDYMTCESTKTSSPLVIEEDVRVKVERLSDEEVHEEVSQPVSASQSSLSDQQTVPGSEQVQEDLLISPQSSSIGSIDEGVTEGLPTLQSTSGGNIHVEDDDRLENVQYPYQLYIAPTTSSTERPSPNGPDRPFQCPTCGVRFTRIQNLKQHMLIHSGIKPFQCDRCGKKFTRAYSLKMHRLKHEGKRCFRCQICSATFTSFGEYKHHMRVSRHIIRKPRIYECKTCGAMFTNSGNLIVHLRSLNHEASELANYFQSSDFLVPDYLNQEHEETLGQYELGEHGFESSSSVQMPVISQVSSTQNCESTFPLGPLGGLLEKEEDLPEQPKTISSTDASREELPKAGLSSITIE